MKHVSLFFLLMALTGSLSATRYHVAPNAAGTNSGLSWADPIDLPGALRLAVSGDEVWVRAGVYTPGQDRHASFDVPAGITLIGGFAGTETSVQQLQRSAPSILSGNIGSTSSAKDNSYTIVRLRSRDHHYSTLDGFVLRDGMGRDFSEGFTASSSGGALFIEPGNGGSAAHQILNCIFLNNQAHNGGAVYVSNGRPVFSDCQFRNNTADRNGGAVYNQGGGAVVSTTFQNCLFEANSSNSGGCITNNGANGQASLLAINCSFVENRAAINGAAIFNKTRGTGDAESVLDGCTFANNYNELGTPDVVNDSAAKSMKMQRRQSGGGRLRPVSARR